MAHEINDMSSTATSWDQNKFNGSSLYDRSDVLTGNSTNPDYTSTSTSNNHNGETKNPVIESLVNKGPKQAEDIITKTKKLLKQNWDQTRHSLGQVQKRMSEMVPHQAIDLIYWRAPIRSGIVFGISLSMIITFMFLSALAAISFWLLAFLIIVGLYKLYNYLMATFIGRIQDDIFDSMFPIDLHISERQAQAWANYIRVNGTSLLKQGRNLFLWNNLTSSFLFGLVLFISFYIGLSMNALTFALIALVLLFTIPKIYQVYRVPIDRAAKQVLDQINQLLAKVTSKLPKKPKQT